MNTDARPAAWEILFATLPNSRLMPPPLFGGSPFLCGLAFFLVFNRHSMPCAGEEKDPTPPASGASRRAKLGRRPDISL
jgi:hypothetical protein